MSNIGALPEFNDLLEGLKGTIDHHIEATVIQQVKHRTAQLTAQTEALTQRNNALLLRNTELQQQLAVASDDPRMSDEQLNKIVSETVERALLAERTRIASEAAKSNVKQEPGLAAAAAALAASTVAKPAAAAPVCSKCTAIMTAAAMEPPPGPGIFINTLDPLQYTRLGSYQGKPVWDEGLSAPEPTARGGRWLTAAEQWTVGGHGLARPGRDYSTRDKKDSYVKRRIIGEEYLRLGCSVAKFRQHYPGADGMSMAHVASEIQRASSLRWHKHWEAEQKAKKAAVAATLKTAAVADALPLSK